MLVEELLLDELLAFLRFSELFNDLLVKGRFRGPLTLTRVLVIVKEGQ